MRRTYWLTVPVVSVMILVVILGLPKPELSYKDRPLSTWLRFFESENLEPRFEAAEALRHFGTNALPVLITSLQDIGPKNEPKWKLMLQSLLTRQKIITANIPRSSSPRTEALAALDAMGPIASNAVPALELLLHESPPDPRAVFVIARLGPNGIPALHRALTNDEKVIRLQAQVCLEMIQSNSELIFPKTREDAEFIRRTCQFNSLVLRAAVQEYKAEHPEELFPEGISTAPKPRLSVEFEQPETDTNAGRLIIPDSKLESE